MDIFTSTTSGVLCVFSLLLYMMLKGGGGALGEDDPEGKGCAWNVLDCQLTQEVVVTLTLRSRSSGKGHTKGAMPGTSGDQKEATVRSRGKRKK